MLAYACAWAMTSGSVVACSRITDWRIFIKDWFSRNESGVGGICDVTPMASEPVGGDVGRKERTLTEGDCLWTY